MSFLLWSPISFYDYSFWNTLCEVVSVSNNRPPFLSFHSASHGTHWMYPHPLLKWIFIESFLFKKYLFSKDMSLSLHKNNTICFTHTHTHSLKRIVLKIYISIWISKSFLTNHFFFCNVICDYMFGAPLRLWPACRRARRVRLTFWWPCTKTEKATTIKYRRTQLPFGGTQMGSLFLPNFMVIP